MKTKDLQCKIVVLDADKSTIGYSELTKSFCLFNERYVEKGETNYKSKHIYFVSDRKINEGDYFLNSDCIKVRKFNNSGKYFDNVNDLKDYWGKNVFLKIEASSDCDLIISKFHNVPIISNNFLIEFCKLNGDIKRIKLETVLEEIPESLAEYPMSYTQKEILKTNSYNECIISEEYKHQTPFIGEDFDSPGRHKLREEKLNTYQFNIRKKLDELNNSKLWSVSAYGSNIDKLELMQIENEIIYEFERLEKELAHYTKGSEL